MDLPPVRPWETTANPSGPVGRAVPQGTPRQQKWATEIKASAVRKILAALDDLLYVRGEDDLRDIGRDALLELLDRLDARQWIDWQVKEKGPVDALVIALWRRCREQAFYRRALPEARAWRDSLAGVGDLANPAEAQASLAQAQRVGYAVVGPGTSSHQIAYLRWCEDQRLPLVVADLGGQYSWFSGPVTSAEHARVRLSLLYCRRSFSDAERAALQASCRVCIPPGDALGAFSVRTGSVMAIVPLGLAIPLAARLRDIAARRGVSEGANPDRPDGRGLTSGKS